MSNGSTEKEISGNTPLADFVTRLIAAIIDVVIVMVVVIPVAFVLARLNFGFIGSLMNVLLGAAVFIAINYKSLSSNGQTIGKKIMKIKIIGEDGRLLPINELITKRYGLYFGLNLLAAIPWIGIVFSLALLVNFLLIFSGPKRQCGHDMIAKTLVVAA